MKRIAVFGMGYVGCVTSACLSRDGHRVMGVDIDQRKVDAVNAGCSPVLEPGLDELINQSVQLGRLTATCDAASAIEQSDMAMVAVGTPSAADGSVRTEALEQLMETIGQVLAGRDKPYVVVIRSTLLPGILEERLARQFADALEEPLGVRVHLCNNPEFLRETTAIRDYDSPPFVLVGASDERVAQEVHSLYAKVRSEQFVTDTRTAALIKYACNAFHALKVDFANEIGTLAQAMEADGQEVMRLVCCDTRLNISPAYLRPGFAFGGSCLPKDVRALTRYAQQHATRTDLLNAILPSNQAHLERAVRIIEETGKRQFGLVGLSFKAGTDDLRESPLVMLAETLLGRGYDLKVYDPGVRTKQLMGTNRAFVDIHLPHLAALLVDDVHELYDHADLLVLGTDVADELDWCECYFGQTLDLRRDLVCPREAAVKTPSQ